MDGRYIDWLQGYASFTFMKEDSFRNIVENSYQEEDGVYGTVSLDNLEYMSVVPDDIENLNEYMNVPGKNSGGTYIAYAEIPTVIAEGTPNAKDTENPAETHFIYPGAFPSKFAYDTWARVANNAELSFSPTDAHSEIKDPSHDDYQAWIDDINNDLKESYDVDGEYYFTNRTTLGALPLFEGDFVSLKPDISEELHEKVCGLLGTYVGVNGVRHSIGGGGGDGDGLRLSATTFKEGGIATYEVVDNEGFCTPPEETTTPSATTPEEPTTPSTTTPEEPTTPQTPEPKEPITPQAVTPPAPNIENPSVPSPAPRPNIYFSPAPAPQQAPQVASQQVSGPKVNTGGKTNTIISVVSKIFT